MKFLPHFPLLMIILFKVYQLENILYNLNGNDSNKCVWGKKHNIVSFYCFFIFRNAFLLSIQGLGIV